MEDFNKKAMNRNEIRQHLKSAMTTLTPNVLDRIDLKQPQEPITDIMPLQSKAISGRRYFQNISVAIAACFCVVFLYGGSMTVYRNGKTDSVIGIDVNPSIELSVNRKNKVLKADALNEDAVEIIDDMELKGVDLNIAVNAVIGSMVKHGYLDDIDNAILVTVSNDSISKAADLRQQVVGDIEDSLKENQVEAVVYDQQAVATDEVKELAAEYNISYGKAYFLKEIISQNSFLTIDDMKTLAALNMEEIAQVLANESFESKAEPESENTGTSAVPTETETESKSETEESTKQTAASETVETTLAETTTAYTPTEEETVVETNIKIDNVDYFNGIVSVKFVTKVKWKNPTVSIKDSDGNTYAALVGNTDSRYCEIEVTGLPAGDNYTFVLGGIYRSGKATTVRGKFDVPVIADEATEAETTEAGTTAMETTASADAAKDSDNESQEKATEAEMTEKETTETETTKAEKTEAETTEKETEESAQG